MRIYHGSDHIIEHPEYGLGKPYNDYGRGFYCTESLDMALEWGVQRGRDGYANAYELNDAGLTLLDLNDEKYGVLHWLALLLANREFDIPSPLALEAKEYLLQTFAIDYEEYDLIRGYRADDSYFSFAQDFINGTISVQQLARAMRLGKLGQQIVLKSERAFERLRFVDAKVAEKNLWYPRWELRDRKARREYLDTEGNRRERGDLYIIQIIDEVLGPQDVRIR